MWEWVPPAITGVVGIAGIVGALIVNQRSIQSQRQLSGTQAAEARDAELRADRKSAFGEFLAEASALQESANMSVFSEFVLTSGVIDTPPESDWVEQVLPVVRARFDALTPDSSRRVSDDALSAILKSTEVRHSLWAGKAEEYGKLARCTPAEAHDNIQRVLRLQAQVTLVGSQEVLRLTGVATKRLIGILRAFILESVIEESELTELEAALILLRREMARDLQEGRPRADWPPRRPNDGSRDSRTSSRDA